MLVAASAAFEWQWASTDPIARGFLKPDEANCAKVFLTGEETALGAREKWKRWHRWGSGIILIWPTIMCWHVLTDDETEKNVSCYRHCCFDLTGDYTLTRKHRENRETIKTTASDVCLLCPHQMSFSSNFSWAVLALHVFVLVRHPGKVDAEQHFVGTRLDFPVSTCMNILILNYCLKYFDHFCLISLYTVQYTSLLPKN